MASPQVLFSVWHPGDGGEDSGHTQTVTLHRSAKAPGKQTLQLGKQRAEAGLDRGTSFCSFWCRRGCSDDPLNSRERSKFGKCLLSENSPPSDHGSSKVSGAPQALIARAAEKPGPALSPWRRSRHTEAEDPGPLGARPRLSHLGSCVCPVCAFVLPNVHFSQAEEQVFPARLCSSEATLPKVASSPLPSDL